MQIVHGMPQFLSLIFVLHAEQLLRFSQPGFDAAAIEDFPLDEIARCSENKERKQPGKNDYDLRDSGVCLHRTGPGSQQFPLVGFKIVEQRQQPCGGFRRLRPGNGICRPGGPSGATLTRRPVEGSKFFVEHPLDFGNQALLRRVVRRQRAETRHVLSQLVRVLI